MAKRQFPVKPQRSVASVSVNSTAADYAARDCQITIPRLYTTQITAKITRKPNARVTLAPVSFGLSAAQLQRKIEKNHAEKAGTELRIRHVRRFV
jgi:hypothetical protein